MPYNSVSDLPDNIKKLSSSKQRQWLSIWNSSYKRCETKGGKDCEGRAFAQANGVVLSKAKMSDDGGVDALPDSAFMYVEPGSKPGADGRTTPFSKRHLPIRNTQGNIDLAYLRSAIQKLSEGNTVPGLSEQLRDKLQGKARAMLSDAHAGNTEGLAGGSESDELAALPDTALYADDEEGIVYRGGLIFRAGDYPDKKFSMTPDDVRAAVDAFVDAVQCDIQHESTVLDGRVGELVAVECSENGEELHGIVAVPKWLDDVLPHRKVSTTWDIETKELVGLAWVRSPRVKDAALLSAFAWSQSDEEPPADHALSAIEVLFAKRHDTHEGQGTIQAIHDVSARGGAVCKRPGKGNMASGHENKAIQKIHDMSAEHGATCSEKSNDSHSFPYFSLDRFKTKSKEAKVSKLSDFQKNVLAFLSENPGEGEEATPAAPVAPVTTAVADQPVDKALFAAERQRAEDAGRQVVELRAALANMTAERIKERAVAFADKVIIEKKAFPAERESIIADFMQRASDDASVGVVKMADGNTTTRVDQMSALFDARPKHMMDEETIIGTLSAVRAVANNLQTVSATAPGAKMSDERREELLGMTELGKQVLTEKNGKRA